MQKEDWSLTWRWQMNFLVVWSWRWCSSCQETGHCYQLHSLYLITSRPYGSLEHVFARLVGNLLPHTVQLVTIGLCPCRESLMLVCSKTCYWGGEARWCARSAPSWMLWGCRGCLSWCVIPNLPENHCSWLLAAGTQVVTIADHLLSLLVNDLGRSKLRSQ